MSTQAQSRSPDPVHVVGAGIAGSWAALLLAEAGREVVLHDREPGPMPGGTSHWGGGMLAPDCESEGAEPVVVRLGRRSLDLWRRHVPEAVFAGTLVVSHPRDRGEMIRFARQTSGHESADSARVAALEPALAGRFAFGLFFPEEGHVEPRRVLPGLHAGL
ncbi:MAG: FAD-dependent oxidoreductase, partial [Methylobacteriaceae bacterium]|nr:FAD-dependent oxidoreductase [Methylobacteriaceae bacterium]